MNIFQRVLFPAILVFSCINESLAVDRFWVGPVGGAYSVATNWNTASDGTGSPGAPTSADDLIIDQNATILIDGNYSPASLYVMNYAQVIFTTTIARTLTIGGGALAPAFVVESGSELNIAGTAAITINMYFGSQCEIYGILDFSGTGSKMDYSAGGTTTIKSAGMIRYGGNSGNGTGSLSSFFVEDQGIFEIYKNGGTFPTGTYAPNSLILNTGATNSPAIFLMTSSTGSYGNYEFNSPLYTATGVPVNADVTFNNLNIYTTGTGKWVFSSSPSSSYTLTVNGSLSVGLDAVFNINSAASGSQPTVVRVFHDIGIEGLVTETGQNTGSVIELAGAEDGYFYSVETGLQNDLSLTLNKTGGALVYGFVDIFLPASANAKFTLTSGVFDMITYGAVMVVQNTSPGAVVGGTVGSHVVGAMRRFTNQSVDYSFPVSNAGDQLAKAVIKPSSTGLTEWTVQFLAPNLNSSVGLTSGIIDEVTDYYWDIARDGTTPADASNISLYYGDLTDPGVVTPTQLNVVYFNGFNWELLGGVAGTGSVTNSLGSTGNAAPADPITDFGIFALGGVVNTLPVSIEYFTGRRSGKIHDLAWKINCNSQPTVTMILERSANAANFTPIHNLTVDASRCLQAFAYSDPSPLPGNNFYRIALQEEDGRISYSRVLLLNNPVDKGSITSVYPSPAAGSVITAQINSLVSGNAVIQVLDHQGRKVSEQAVKLEAGQNQIRLDISPLPQGAYQMMLVNSDGNISIMRFIRTR